MIRRKKRYKFKRTLNGDIASKYHPPSLKQGSVPSTRSRRISSLGRSHRSSIQVYSLSSFNPLFFQALHSPATTSDNRSPIAYVSVCLCVYVYVCADLFCTNIYKRSRPRARVQEKRDIPFRERIARLSRGRGSLLGRVQRVPLPAFFPLHSFFFIV